MAQHYIFSQDLSPDDDNLKRSILLCLSCSMFRYLFMNFIIFLYVLMEVTTFMNVIGIITELNQVKEMVDDLSGIGRLERSSA